MSSNTAPPTYVLMVEGATASCMAAVFSNPCEVAKTRLQLQGELQASGNYQVAYRGTLDAIRTIAQKEGIAAIQKGLLASFAHQFVLNGIRLGLYIPVGQSCEKVVGSPGVVTNFMSGFICGGIGGFAGSPLFLAKTRLQAQSEAALTVGTQHHYSGVRDALTKIVRADGFGGLFHGVQNAIWRTSMGSAVQLSTYDGVKANVAKYMHWESTDTRLHLVSSLCGAGVVTLAMNPFDVVMTRSYNNPNHEYRGNIASSLLKIGRTEGIMGLYKGSFALWGRIGPHTVFTFLFLEKIRAFRSQYFSA